VHSLLFVTKPGQARVCTGFFVHRSQVTGEAALAVSWHEQLSQDRKSFLFNFKSKQNVIKTFLKSF